MKQKCSLTGTVILKQTNSSAEGFVKNSDLGRKFINVSGLCDVSSASNSHKLFEIHLNTNPQSIGLNKFRNS